MTGVRSRRLWAFAAQAHGVEEPFGGVEVDRGEQDPAIGVKVAAGDADDAAARLEVEGGGGLGRGGLDADVLFDERDLDPVAGLDMGIDRAGREGRSGPMEAKARLMRTVTAQMGAPSCSWRSPRTMSHVSCARGPRSGVKSSPGVPMVVASSVRRVSAAYWKSSASDRMAWT